MGYLEFKNRWLNTPVILSRDLVRFRQDAQTLRNQLNRWQDRGLLVKLKKGMYLLNENDRKINPSRAFIAGQLYWPSYVSLEYALGFYDLIPERVADVTSVTTKKTVSFENKMGKFLYQHIQPEAFRGIQVLKDDAGLTFFIACPEKAVVDWLYLNLHRIPLDTKDIFSGSFRFQNVNMLKTRRIMEFAGLFHNNKLMKAAGDFCGFIREGGRG